MGNLERQGSDRARPVQGARPGGLPRHPRACAAGSLLAAALLGGCGGGQNPVMTPVGWWHDLQGGAIAEQRPPPPGADLPYPHIGRIPEKPILPSASFRQTVFTQLSQERDTTEQRAARNPIVVEVPAPPPPPPPEAAAVAGGAAGAAPAAPDDQSGQGLNVTVPAAETKAKDTPAASPPPAPPQGVVLAGADADQGNLPPIPEAPPPPANLPGVAPEPVSPPAPPPPVHLEPKMGEQVLFSTGSAVFPDSQMPTVKDVVARRGKGKIAVEGHGEAESDSPSGQEAALKLALARAQAVAGALRKQHVPDSAIVLSGTAFGRGASVSDVP
jgi:outer membrane protein OmpA-like peptidoglycan-associated protein